MFNSSEHGLVHFLFANDKDCYFRSSMLKLDLNQYLWFLLKEKGFSRVFFLLPSEKRDGFSVSSFENESNSGPKRGLFGVSSVKRAFQKWLTTALKSKTQKTAIICSLNIFCDIVSDQSWDSLLNELSDLSYNQERTGILILTMSCYAEDSAGYLRNSRAFQLQQNKKSICQEIVDIRALNCDLFGEMKRRLGDRCTFLNLFTQEQVRNILLFSLINQGIEYTDNLDIDYLANILFLELTSQDFRERYPLFDENLTGTFDSLRTLCQQKSFISRLKEISTRVSDGEYAAYSSEAAGIPMMHRDELIVRCQALAPPGSLKNDPNTKRELQWLKGGIQIVRSRPENQDIREQLNNLLTRAEGIVFGLSPQHGANQDGETFLRILKGMNLCVKWISADADGNVERSLMKILETINTAIEISSAIFTKEYGIQRTAGNPLAKSFQEANLAQIYVLRHNIEMLDSIIAEKSARLGDDMTMESMQEIINSLTQHLEQMRDNIQTNSVSPGNKPEEKKTSVTTQRVNMAELSRNLDEISKRFGRN